MTPRRHLVLGPKFGDPFGMLTSCHERIRHFTEVARRIAVPTHAPPAAIAEAAARVHLYFGTALPLHEQDEEDTLWRALADADVSAAAPLFDRLRAEHRAIEEVVHRLLPWWEALANAPEDADVRARASVEDADALAAAFAPHLVMEEEELYPLARARLPEHVLAPMLDTMRARRAPVFASLSRLHS